VKIPVQSARASSTVDTPTVELGTPDGTNLLIDLLPTMAWTATVHGNVDFVNQQCCLFSGLSREQLLGGGLAECIHPDDLEITNKVRLQLADTHPFEYELRVRRYDGEYIRCLTRAVPVQDSHGQVAKWVGTTIDVEDMRRASDELRLQEDHLQLALDAADIGIWRLKLPSSELTVDERTRRHLGFDRHVITAYNPEDVIHPQDFAHSSISTPDNNGRYAAEHRVKQPDGTYRWQAIHWRVYLDGDGANAAPALITGTSMDVTSRKQAQAEKEELDQRYRIALAAAGLGTWSCDVEQRVMHLDDRARAHFNVDEPILTLEQCLARVDDADREVTIQRVRRQLGESGQKNRATVEFRVRNNHGEVRWMSSQLQIKYASDDASRPVRCIGVTRDITDNKQAEEKVKRLNTDLERRVQQRTAELTAANEELESFAYSVSHDLRAPLRAMWGFSDALVEEYGQSLPPQAHQYLQHVIDGSRHLGDIIDGLLTLSRSTRGALRRDIVDLSSVAENAIRELARVEPGRHVEWAIQPALRAQGDSRMIDAVMRNLLSNAWKYTANRADALIRVYGEHVNGNYAFCVEDNGAGFDMNHVDKLFQPFQRLHRQDEFTGLGIGLATVQRIIHRHGGTVSGTGVPGQGAKFCFSLPFPDENVASAVDPESKS
jgi:PAS domain S-box-containing protein